MRTTLTIDDAIAKALKQRAFETGMSFKAVVNEALRRGLEPAAPKRMSKQKFRQRSFALGLPKVDLVKANALAAELENQALLQKQELGK